MNLPARYKHLSINKITLGYFWSRWGTTIPLILILSLGAALRLYGLDGQSLWNDELSGWRRSSYDTLAEVLGKGIPVDHPPGYQVFLFYWIRLVGDSEVYLRLPSALVGIGAIYAIFLLGRKLYSTTEGLIAAGLMTVLWTPIYYSQEARANIISMLLAILSTYWLIDIGRGLEHNRKVPFTAVIGYLLTAITSSYLHYFGLFFILLQAAFMGLYFLRRPHTWIRLFGLYAVILLAYFPWIVQAVNLFIGRSSSWTNNPPSDAFWRFGLFLFNNSPFLTGLVLLLWAVLLTQVILTILRQSESRRQNLLSPGSLLIIWLIIPVLLVYARVHISEGIWHNRNFLIVVPAAYLLTARAITQLPYRRAAVPLATLSLLGMIIYQLLWVQNYYTRPQKEQFREAVALIVENNLVYPDAPIIGWAWHKTYFDYYFTHWRSARRVDQLLGQQSDIAQAEAFIAAADSPYIWYIAAHRPPDPEFFSFLHSEMDIVLHQSFIKADVWLFEQKQIAEGNRR
jgi:uncharacterized membrane protein